LCWPGFHVLGEFQCCIKELILILIRSHIIIIHRDNIWVWGNLILLDESSLSPVPSTNKVVQETTSVEWMKKVGKAVGLNLSSIFWIPETKT
jgi:hypothetical protein